MGEKLPFWVHVQSLLGRVFYIPLMGWVSLGYKIAGYRVLNQQKHRKLYWELTEQNELPLLICPNHMTFIDSIVLIYTFGNHFSYPFYFRRHPWNLVASEYLKNPLFRFVCYFSKCIFISREKEREQNYPTLNLSKNLLQNGEVLLIFPEGRRTKTGRFDESKLAYGVGRLVKELGECRVLCTYLRSDRLEKAASFPPRKSRFEMLTDVAHYKASDMGDDAVGEITRDVSRRIKALEEQYFLEQ